MKRAPIFATEADLARVVVAYLHSWHWEVYTEVQIRTYGPVADIVATLGPRLIIVETKLTLGLRVIEQAARWAGFAHNVYAAVPLPGRGRDFGFACNVARTFGVGVWSVYHYSGDSRDPRVSEEHPAPWHRGRYASEVRAVLTDDHKSYAEAGNAAGRHWTPFQQTTRAVRAYLAEHPGASIKDVVANIDHHYSTPASARGSLSTYIAKGIIKGIRADWSVRPARFYVDEPEVA